MEPISTNSIIDVKNQQNFVTLRDDCLINGQVQIVAQQQTGQQQQQQIGSPVENNITVFKSPPPPPPQQAAAIVIPINRTLTEETTLSVSEAHSTSVSSCSSFQNHPTTNSIVISNQTTMQFNSEPLLSTSSTGPSTDKTNSSNDSTQNNVTLPSDGQQKKRKKSFKKAAKLDVKLKLEKSRQSARECRARKKLRYQYLEDLVCNREKAVMILRDELVKVRSDAYVFKDCPSHIHHYGNNFIILSHLRSFVI